MSVSAFTPVLVRLGNWSEAGSVHRGVQAAGALFGLAALIAVGGLLAALVTSLSVLAVAATMLVAVALMASSFVIVNRRLTTEVALAEERSEHADAMRLQAERCAAQSATMVSNLSHEIRAPLQSILSYATLIEDAAQARRLDEIARDVTAITDASTHLTEIAERLLTLQRAEGSNTQPELQQVSLNTFIGMVESLAKPLMRKGGNRFDIIVEGIPGTISTDPVRLRQILFNLLSNAGKFTHKGQVTLRVTRRPGRRAGETGDIVLFSVRDTGPGIPENEISQLFQPFFRGVDKRDLPGAGLGLALSRAHARELGGDVTVMNNDDAGATFTLSVPADPGTAPAAAR